MTTNQPNGVPVGVTPDPNPAPVYFDFGSTNGEMLVGEAIDPDPTPVYLDFGSTNGEEVR